MNAFTHEPGIISVDDLTEGIERYTTVSGYRLDMIVPADSPVAALLSRHGETIRLESSNVAARLDTSKDGWATGRAGMMYRDLIPGRLGGKLIASHIRLTVGGEVPDYVHYHKVQFQMIYCVRGAIKVVYEGQGEPFWLMPGDCVLQPPEIRHRVLWAEEGSEVVELGMPAAHETWVEHDVKLPTADLAPDREYSGQRFVRHIAADHAGDIIRDTGISAATRGFADVQVITLEVGEPFYPFDVLPGRETVFGFVTLGEIRVDTGSRRITEGAAFIDTAGSETAYVSTERSELVVAGF